MENSFIMSCVNGGISCNEPATKYFHCIMIPKAERLFRQTHPVVFSLPPVPAPPQSSGPQRSISPLSRERAFTMNSYS